jgi:hypothetical protein
MRRNPIKTIAGALLLLAYGACTIPWGTRGEYSGTVVDGDTGQPIEGAVAIEVWTKCVVLAMDSCGDPHSLRETVTGPDGKFSLAATPSPDWNPFTYIRNPEPEIEIHAVGYLPVAAQFSSDPALSGLSIPGLAEAMRREPTIKLGRPKSAGQMKEWAIEPLFPAWNNQPHAFVMNDAPALEHLLNLQRAQLGLPPLRGKR